jgi:two-component sensor histidine kinase
MRASRPASPAPDTVVHHLVLTEFIHRSANDFAVACAEVNLARRASSLDAARDRLESVHARLVALCAIQRLLQPPTAATMDLGSRLCELCELHAEARFAQKGVFVRACTIDVSIDAGRGWGLLMIVSELLTNAAKHAFDTSGGIVCVDLATAGGGLMCIVSDDGAGLPAHRARTGTGTTVVMELARLAGIRLTIAPCDVGSRFELRVGPPIG